MGVCRVEVWDANGLEELAHFHVEIPRRSEVSINSWIGSSYHQVDPDKTTLIKITMPADSMIVPNDEAEVVVDVSTETDGIKELGL